MVFAAAWVHNVSGATNPTMTPAGGSTGRYEMEGATIGGFAAMQCIELVASGTTTAMSVDIASAENGTNTWGIIAFVINAASSATSDQEGARFGIDDGAEAAHSWEAAQDTNITVAAGETRLVNIIVNATGTLGAKAFKLQYRKVGDPDWRDMPVQ